MRRTAQLLENKDSVDGHALSAVQFWVSFSLVSARPAQSGGVQAIDEPRAIANEIQSIAWRHHHLGTVRDVVAYVDEKLTEMMEPRSVSRRLARMK